MPEINTIEDARAEILRLQDQITELTNERDTLSQDKVTLSGELDNVRKLNQQYFNKLSQQFVPAAAETEDDDKEPVSCEDFARSLNII